MIIGINGKIGSGKDTVAAMIAEEMSKDGWRCHWKIFAGKLKHIVELLTGVIREIESDNSYSNEVSNYSQAQKEIFVPEYGKTIGQMLQYIGTELMRNQLHKETWITALFADYEREKKFFGDGLVWIVVDARFPNEADKIKQLGGKLLRVTGDPLGVNANSTRDTKHESEVALDDYEEFDAEIVNDGTLEDLREKVKGIVPTLIMGNKS